jgi:uncharacterized protein (UPF0210 family)
MKLATRLFLCLSLIATSATPAMADSSSGSLPRVRAITAFVRLDRATYRQQIDEALVVLRGAKEAFAKRGYAVETLRIVTQPLGQLTKGQTTDEALAFLQEFDALAVKEDFLPDVGPAMMTDSDSPDAMRLLARLLSSASIINGSAIIAADDGIYWRIIRESARLVREVTRNSPGSKGNFNFTATAMLAPYGPFYPGAWHDGAGRQFSIGFEGANVVQDVFAATRGDFKASVTELTRRLQIHVDVGEAIGETVAKATGWDFKGVDPTPAPLGDISIGDAIERFTDGKFGGSGTLTASLAITTAVKAVRGKIVGYAGLMVPVMEDKRLAARWAENTYNIDALLAYSAVCGTGLDTVPLPGDISEDRLAQIFGDVAALAWKWHKPLSARLQPIKDKKPGETSDFDSPYLFNTSLHGLP